VRAEERFGDASQNGAKWHFGVLPLNVLLSDLSNTLFVKHLVLYYIVLPTSQRLLTLRRVYPVVDHVLIS